MQYIGRDPDPGSSWDCGSSYGCGCGYGCSGGGGGGGGGGEAIREGEPIALAWADVYLGESPGTIIPHNRDYLAISKPAQATIANLNSDLNNKALFTRIIPQYSAVYFNRVLSLFITTRALSLGGPNSKCASFISLMRVYRSSLSPLL